MGEPSSALRLGFTDIKPTGKEGGRGIADLESTPSKIGVPSSPFTFRFTRETGDVGLSGDAQRMMEELREKAAEIKAELVAKREAEAEASDGPGRRIAKPKGKSGRFSAAHMAEFKKMDSIEGHASAWRADRNRLPPASLSSLKRSPSKANLDATTPTSQTKSTLRRSPSKPDVTVMPATPRLKPSLKRSSSRADLDEYQQSPSPKKTALPVSTTKPISSTFGQRFASKRLKQNLDDDASSARPVSRDGTSIPRPKSSGSGVGGLPSSASTSSLARLMSPTKASLAHTAAQGKPTVSLVKPPSKPDLKGGLIKSATTSNLLSPAKPMIPRDRVISPGRFQRVKSILKGQRTASGNVQTAIPMPTVSQTPAPPRVDKELPPLPLTTPRRKLGKHVAFTPEVARFVEEQNSPSPQKVGMLRLPSSGSKDTEQLPTLDGVLAKSQSGDVKYPDLSGFRPLPRPPAQEAEAAKPSVPGTFTFRSDHTIRFGDAPAAGFGGLPGQSSVRQVRPSIKPGTTMPGSFPDPTSPTSHPNKENKVPGPSKLLFGAAHGMSNKKRHRATWDEEELERDTDERAAKKRKNEHVPEGDALVAPRLVASTPKSAKKTLPPPRTPGTASPTKKRGMLSMSRLNMLARPKNRA